MAELKNYKIRISSPEISEAVQKMAFELGYSWGINQSKELDKLEKPFLYFSSATKMITYSDYTSREGFFESCKEVEISVEDFLMLKNPIWELEDYVSFHMDVRKTVGDNPQIVWGLHRLIKGFSSELNQKAFKIYKKRQYGL